MIKQKRRNNNAFGKTPSQRQQAVLSQKKRFLIVCGGEETEPNYFKAFAVASTIVLGTNYDPLYLVEYALNEKKRRGYINKLDQVWVVFDKDEFPPDRYHRAIIKARDENIGAAYSNEAFELWFLLHYDYHTVALTRSHYCDKLSEKIGKKYTKNDRQMYAYLRPQQTIAVSRAEKLLKSYGISSHYAQHNPCTTVHLLVNALNAELIR